MKRKDLEALEIGEEAVDQIMALHGKAMKKLQDDSEAATASLEALQSQLTEAQQTIEGFKEMDVDSIKAAADDYKTKYEQAQEDAKKQVAALKFDHALEDGLRAAKAKNPKSVKALLDVEKLELGEDGVITGLDTQLETIKAENDFLFASDKPEPKIVTGGNPRSTVPDAIVDAAREGAGLKK